MTQIRLLRCNFSFLPPFLNNTRYYLFQFLEHDAVREECGYSHYHFLNTLNKKGNQSYRRKRNRESDKLVVFFLLGHESVSSGKKVPDTSTLFRPSERQISIWKTFLLHAFYEAWGTS